VHRAGALAPPELAAGEDEVCSEDDG
jgi:hypothetical protein